MCCLNGVYPLYRGFISLYLPFIFEKHGIKRTKGEGEKVKNMGGNGRKWMPLEHGLNPCRGGVIRINKKS